MIVYTHVEHSPMKTIYIKYYIPLKIKFPDYHSIRDFRNQGSAKNSQGVTIPSCMLNPLPGLFYLYKSTCPGTFNSIFP